MIETAPFPIPKKRPRTAPAQVEGDRHMMFPDSAQTDADEYCPTHAENQVEGDHHGFPDSMQTDADDEYCPTHAKSEPHESDSDSEADYHTRQSESHHLPARPSQYLHARYTHAKSEPEEEIDDEDYTHAKSEPDEPDD